MRNYLFLFLILPFSLMAQQSDSTATQPNLATSAKIATWYRNSYQPSNQKTGMTSANQSQIYHPSIAPYRLESSPFLFLPYVIPRYSYNQSQVLRNTPYNYGYFDPTGASTIGQLLLAGGINYLVDKTIVGKQKKTKRKR